MTKSVNGNTYVILYVLVLEVCEQRHCRSSEMPVGMHFIFSSSTSSFVYLLPQNGDFLLASLPRTEKNKKAKTSLC